MAIVFASCVLASLPVYKCFVRPVCVVIGLVGE